MCTFLPVRPVTILLSPSSLFGPVEQMPTLMARMRTLKVTLHDAVGNSMGAVYAGCRDAPLEGPSGGPGPASVIAPAKSAGKLNNFCLQPQFLPVAWSLLPKEGGTQQSATSFSTPHGPGHHDRSLSSKPNQVQLQLLE